MVSHVSHWKKAKAAAVLHVIVSLLGAWIFIAVAQDTALEAQCARFDVAQNASLQLQWQLLAAGKGGPFTRISHTSVALSSPPRVLIIGGIEYESAQPTVINTTIVYDPQADTFKLPLDQIQSSAAPVTATTSKDDVFTSPASRVEHASTLVSYSANIVLLFGGQNKEFLNDLWRLCVSADSTQAKWDQLVVPASDAVSLVAMPPARIGHSISVVYENTSFSGSIVYGGLSEEYTEVGTQLHLALIARSSLQSSCGDRSPRVYWRVLNIVAGSVQPVARSYHAMAPVSRLFSSQRIVCLLMYGGKSSITNTIYGDVWRLCPVARNGTTSVAIESQTYQWEQLTPVDSRGPGPRYGSAITFVDEGKIAIAGGSYAFPNDFLNDLWEFNYNATQWLSLRFDQDFTPPRRGHSIALLADRLYLFGGRDRYSVVNKRMEVTTYAAPYCATGLKITLCDATSTYVCVPCPAGYFLEGGTRNCLPCSAGTYSSEGSATCTKCPVGTYNTLTAQTNASACLACPAGSYSNVVGAALASTCSFCGAGTFAPSPGASVCGNCVAGTFSSAYATSCTPCSVGEWSSSASAQCSKCSAGSYNPRNGSAVCFPCPKGFYSEAGVPTCQACPVNTFSPRISTAGASNCAACPPLMFTRESGQSSCQYCAAGTTLASNGSYLCEPCATGSYSGGISTSGACAPCPLHSFSNSSGAIQCQNCPPGTLTAATGSTSASDCHVCSNSQYFDGSNCQSCAPGTILSSSSIPYCELCAPGTYTSTAVEASQSSGCQSCPSMAIAAQIGSSSCASCPDNSFAMAGWRSCISCVSSSLTECLRGRNGLTCAGNGACALRGCECKTGWGGSDCSTPTSASVVSESAVNAVMFFPANESRVVLTRSPSASTFEVRVKRSGSLAGELRARIQVRNTNASTVPTSIFPTSVTIPSGSTQAVVSFSTTAFASSVVGSACRSLILELVDVGTVSVSAVSVDVADRTLSLFFDDQNGPITGDSGSGQARSITAQYSIASGTTTVQNGAVAVLNRVVATKLRLQPLSSTDLNSLPLHFRVAADATINEARGFVDLFPATVAAIQATYSSSPRIRMGMLSTSSTIYQSLASFFVDSQQLNTTAAPITWKWLADRVSESNGTQWAMEDRTVRRFLLVFASSASLTDDPAAFAASLRQAAAVALVVLPPGQSLSSTLPSDVIQIVTLPTSGAEAPQRIVAALQARDNSASTATILADSDSLIQAATPITVSSGGTLPTIDLTLVAMPSSVVNSTVRISIPGFFALNVTLLEPGASCFPLPPSDSLLPFDEQPLSGWLGAWHLLSDAEWNRQWKVPAALNFTQRRYNDSSLLRSARSSVIALTTSSGSRRVTLVRSFDGSSVAPGLGLVARGYVRHAGSSSDGVSCALRVILVPSDGNSSTLEAQQPVTTRSDWTYIRLATAVPFEVSTMQIQMDCNTTSGVSSVEWTSLGLFPDPQTACQCPRGYFYDNGVCVRCPAGSYCVAGIKRECPLGFFSFGKAASCERCRDGWICVDGLVRLCEAGTYASPQSSCAVCPSGYACRNGKMTICPIGTFSLARASDCQLCPPGTISTAEGSSSCALCPLSSTSNFQRDHCVDCPAGETTTFLGQHACSSCAATAIWSRNLPEVCVA